MTCLLTRGGSRCFFLEILHYNFDFEIHNSTTMSFQTCLVLCLYDIGLIHKKVSEMVHVWHISYIYNIDGSTDGTSWHTQGHRCHEWRCTSGFLATARKNTMEICVKICIYIKYITCVWYDSVWYDMCI